MSNYFLRDEPFGYTFFDKKLLRHKFLRKDQLDDLLLSKSIQFNEVEQLHFKRKDYRTDILYSPIRIYYELTLACNRYCRYCFNSSGYPRKDELTTAEVLKSLDHFKETNVIDIRFTGGELTKRRDWFEILKYAKDLGFAVSCNTNAAYFDDSICDKFAELKLEQVTVSIDGNKEHHEFNRGIGSFDRTMHNLKKMHDLGVILRINTLVNKYSMNDVEFMLDLASKYTDEINFFTIVFIGRGANLEATDAVSVEENLEMSTKIEELKPKYPKLNILHFAQSSRNTSVDEDVSSNLGLRVGIPSGTTTFNVLSNGCFSCGGYAPYIDSSLTLGNVKTDNLFDTWQKNSALEKIRDDGRKLILFCSKCEKFIQRKCQGTKYETELNRLKHPEVKNPTCLYGNGPSLLAVS